MFNLRIVKEYLKHRLKAKNRHGLHSPFVYKLVDEVVYDFTPKKVYTQFEELPNNVNQTPRSKKLNRLLYRIISERQSKDVLLMSDYQNIMNDGLLAAIPQAKIHQKLDSSIKKFDVVVIDIQNESRASEFFNNCLNFIDEHTLIIIKNIHVNSGMTTVWEEIKANQNVTVTVDMFWLGLVYFRKGQVKEDFWIRF